MESNFSLSLTKIIQLHHQLAMQAIVNLIDTQKFNLVSVGEAMRVIGRLEDSDTYRTRFEVLTHNLLSKYLVVRDGALIGLGSMNDPEAISYIEEAIKNEEVEESREDMKQILEDLNTSAYE
jgi:hypothetical protein